MRTAILGDIHGNVSALSAVLEGARRERAEMLLVTGDFVGYYYRPDLVMRALSEWNYLAVRGNHEDMLFEALADETVATRYRAKYGSGLDAASACLSPEELSDLSALPASIDTVLDGKRLVLAHGAPWDTDCYIYPDAAADKWERLGAMGADYIVLGHTHYRFSKCIGDTLIINPGSVGQPRDRTPGAAWTLLDTETDTTTFFTEPYDIDAVAAEARQMDPHLPYLWEVLSRR